MIHLNLDENQRSQWFYILEMLNMIPTPNICGELYLFLKDAKNGVNVTQKLIKH